MQDHSIDSAPQAGMVLREMENSYQEHFDSGAINELRKIFTVSATTYPISVKLVDNAFMVSVNNNNRGNNNKNKTNLWMYD